MAAQDLPVGLRSRNRAPLAALLAVPAPASDDASAQTTTAASPPAGQENQSGTPTVFTVPPYERLYWAAEIPQRVAGITDEDSYLFVTYDNNGGHPKTPLRAFIVPKSDPTKQYEIPAEDGEIDVKRKEFRLKLGEQKLSFIDGIVATLDGKSVRSIDTVSPEIDGLVKKTYGLDWSGANESGSYEFTGDSWIIIRKDAKTGLIEKFTQSGTSGLGRLEVIQGDADRYYYARGAKFLAWEPTYEETMRAPISTSEAVALPESMRSTVYDELRAQAQYRSGILSKDGGMMSESALQALKGLMPDSVQQEIKQQRKEHVDQLNAEEGRKKGLGRNWPSP